MSSNLPVEVLRMILENVDKTDLLTLCRVNKVCCSCSQHILYRNISSYGPSGPKVWGTLAQSTHLARHVRSFSAYYPRSIDQPNVPAMAMQNMSSLRSLKLLRVRHTILDECTFKLDSFITDSPLSEYLQNFLNNQPTLTHVELYRHTIDDDDAQAEFEVTCLPNLTRVAAELPLLQRLIPGRPLSEVDVVWYPGYHIPSLDFFTLSTAPIQKLKLAITSHFIYTTPVEFLASIFPSLTHLSICLELEVCLDVVRAPLFSFLESLDIKKASQQRYEWIENTLSALDSLKVFDIDLGEIDSDYRVDYLPLITQASSRLQYVTIFDGEYHYWKRLRGEWVVCEKSECHQV
jgi:hypothetical protein